MQFEARENRTNRAACVVGFLLAVGIVQTAEATPITLALDSRWAVGSSEVPCGPISRPDCYAAVLASTNTTDGKISALFTVDSEAPIDNIQVAMRIIFGDWIGVYGGGMQIGPESAAFAGCPVGGTGFRVSASSAGGPANFGMCSASSLPTGTLKEFLASDLSSFYGKNTQVNIPVPCCVMFTENWDIEVTASNLRVVSEPSALALLSLGLLGLGFTARRRPH